MPRPTNRLARPGPDAHRPGAPTSDRRLGARAQRRVKLSAVAESEVAAEVRELSRVLLPEADRLGVLMADRICAEIPVYAEGRLVSREEVDASCAENIRLVLGHGR